MKKQHLFKAALKVTGLLVLTLLMFNLTPARSAYAATFVVTKTADTNDGTCDADCSLREAIGAANALPGADTITFDASLDGTPITLSITGINEDANATGDLDITDALTITGNGVTNTIIDANRATVNDRAFDIRSGVAVTFNDLTIRNGAGPGGAVRFNVANTTLTINNSRLADAVTAGQGGAIAKTGSGSTLTINDSTFENNQSSSFGGGIYSQGGGAVTINRSTFINNRSVTQYGGAVFSDAPLQINNSTFNSNTAVGGGAIGHTSTIIISNNTFYGNSATSGAEVIHRLGGGVTLRNNIITGYTGSACNFAGVATNNLVDDTSCQAGAVPVTNFDTTLQDNGGSTLTHALLNGSNAIDTGASNCPDHTATPLATDQRGLARPQGAVCDIGAVETGLTVTTDGDVVDANGGSCAGMGLDDLPGADGLTSLREAICVANNNPGADTIYFASSLDGTPITLSIPGTGENANATGDLDITDDLTITGNGARNTIINGGGIDRVFHVVTNGNYNINALSITNGSTSADGGGIYVKLAFVGIVNLDGLTIANNHATAGFGGGIYTTGTINISNSTLSNNTATGGGGGMYSDSGTVTITNSTISGNSANGDSGGLRLWDSGTVIHSTIVNNIADADNNGSGNGGGVGANVTLQNSILANNIDLGGQAPNCGGGGTQVSNNYNLIEDVTGCGIVLQANDISGVDPNLGVLQDNSGNTNTHALLASSQAIDHIPGGSSGCGTTYIVDQRGVARPQNNACDVGAYELVNAVGGGVAGGLGPGGVGHTDGSTALVLWLRSDDGIYSDAGCSTDATPSGNVGCWEDQSGNGFDPTNASNQPTYQTAIVNGLPVIRFVRSSQQRLVKSYEAALNPATFTIFGTWQVTGTPNSFRTPLSSRTNGGCCGYNLYAGNNNTWQYWHGWNAMIGTTPVTLNNWELIAAKYDATNRELYADGVLDTSAASAYTPNATNPFCVGGVDTCDINNFDGDISEIAIFNTALNSVQQTLVDNYLSAKYNIALNTGSGALDVYDGDTGGNGDFDLDVAGIGQFGGDQHTQSHAAGMIVVDVDFLQDDGDWLLFGHRSPISGNSTADLPTTGDWATAPEPQRWERHFYIDVTDDTTTVDCSVTTCLVDIIFDYSEGSMDACCPPGGDVNNYRLLKRTGTTGQFADIATATAIVGDQVHFQGVDVADLGSNFTLGTLDDANSPTAVTLQNPTTANTQPIIFLLILLVLLGMTGVVWHGRKKVIG